jgi:glycogen(starch) synthase
MRVALVTPELPARRGGGGIGTYMAIAGEALARQGHRVRVVMPAPGSGGVEGSVEVVAVKPPSLPSPAASRLVAQRWLAAAVRSFRPDVVHAAEWEALAWWIARRGTVPVVTHLATPTYLVDVLNGRPPSPQTSFVRRLERDQARRSAALAAPSRAIAERVGRDWGLDPGVIEVIPNPLDVDAVRRAGEAEPPLALPERFIAFSGRLERRKGVGDLAGALPAVLERHRDLHAVLVGRDAGESGGDVTAELRELTRHVADRVHTPGELSREAALAVVARAELVVLPSRWEAFGIVATEALALGRPVVATSGSGLAEIVQQGRSGWLAPPGDPEALGRTLLAALDDREGLRRAGEEARARAEAFRADAVADRLGALLERAASGARS